MNLNGMTVAVCGSTGFVGRHVVAALTGQGCRVRALVRDREKARGALPEQGVEWVVGDGTDRGAVGELVAGSAAAVQCIGIRREFPPRTTFARQHVMTARVLTEAMRSAGVGRLVHVSALGTRPDAATKYHRSKFEAETIVRNSGLEWTILRPSLVHGADGEFMSMAKDWVLGRAAPWFVLPYFVRVEPPSGFPPAPKLVSAKVQPVHVDDVAQAVVASLRDARAVGEVYALGGPEAFDWPTLLTTIRDTLPITEKWKKPAPLPGVLGAAVATAAEAIGMGGALPFGPSEPIMATEDSVCAMDKAREHLGLRPRGFTSSLKQYAAQI
ncbi:MAG: NAD(P)H-binding protein [Planctomycetota bacterium]|nr:NAD(P)H-binding protein [Planctomycetota bacterium]